VLPKIDVLLFVFCGQKGLSAKDIHKDIFSIYGGKCLSRKAVHNWAANVSLMTKRLKRRCGSGRENKRLLCCGFRGTHKAMKQVYQCWWRVCREINVIFQFRISNVFVLYSFVAYLLTLPRTLHCIKQG
jgi:hypothetical protein